MFLVLPFHIQLLDRQGFNEKWPVGILFKDEKNLLYRHSCRPCRVSDAREQEPAVSLDVNPFLSVLGFRFTTSQIPCHALPNAQAARDDEVRK